MTTIQAIENPNNDNAQNATVIPWQSDEQGVVTSYTLSGEIGDNFSLSDLAHDWDVFQISAQAGDRMELSVNSSTDRNRIFYLIFDDQSNLVKKSDATGLFAFDSPDGYAFTETGDYYLLIHSAPNFGGLLFNPINIFDSFPNQRQSSGQTTYNYQLTLDLRDNSTTDNNIANDADNTIILQNTSNTSSEKWFIDGTNLTSNETLPSTNGLDILGTGDFNSDGNEDLVLQNTSGLVTIQFLDANSDYLYEEDLLFTNGLPFDVVAVGDFENSGKKDDLVLQSPNYTAAGIVLMNGTSFVDGVRIPEFSNLPLDIESAGDFDGDGYDDLLVQAPDYSAAGIVFMNGTTVDAINKPPQVLPELAGESLDIVGGVKDYNEDGNEDFIVQSPDNSAAAIVYMNGAAIESAGLLPSTNGYDIVA